MFNFDIDTLAFLMCSGIDKEMDIDYNDNNNIISDNKNMYLEQKENEQNYVQVLSAK